MRKERFISERKGKNGTSYFVRVRIGNDEISKTFSDREYGSSRVALDCAIKFRNKAMVDIAENNVFRKNNITVREVFDDYLESCPLRYNTKYKYQKLFNVYILHKDVPVQDLTKAMILQDLNAMIDRATNDTIQRVFSVYKNAIIYNAINHNYIDKDLSLGLKAPQSRLYAKPKSTEVDRETIDKVKSIFISRNTYDGQIIAYLIEVLYFTGMRPAEAEALTKQDIYDDYIDINKELGSDSFQNNVVRQCKTFKSNRRVPIHPQLKPILDRLIAYAKYNDLFRRENGAYMDSTWVGNTIRNAIRRSGIKFNLYMLRHNMATALVTSKVDARTIMDLLGHANYSMSLDYARSTDKLKTDALLSIE